MTREQRGDAGSHAGRIRVGVGGWTFEPWRGLFYPDELPQKRELAYASRRLTSIEINGTFYRTQTPASFAKWRDETPDDFVFAIKAPRYIVQKRALAETEDSIARFLASGLDELGDKLGPILWQFSPTRKFDAVDIEAFLKLLPRELGGRPLRHALEVRHESFADTAFIDLARAHGVAIVADCESKYPEIADATAPFVYLRVMGAQETPKDGYSAKALDVWAARVQALARGEHDVGLRTIAPVEIVQQPRDVFLYFISGFKARNPAAARALIERLP